MTEYFRIPEKEGRLFLRISRRRNGERRGESRWDSLVLLNQRSFRYLSKYFPKVWRAKRDLFSRQFFLYEDRLFIAPRGINLVEDDRLERSTSLETITRAWLIGPRIYFFHI